MPFLRGTVLQGTFISSKESRFRGRFNFNFVITVILLPLPCLHPVVAVTTTVMDLVTRAGVLLLLLLPTR